MQIFNCSIIIVTLVLSFYCSCALLLYLAWVMTNKMAKQICNRDYIYVYDLNFGKVNLHHEVQELNYAIFMHLSCVHVLA